MWIVSLGIIFQVHSVELSVLDQAQQRQAILAEQLSRQSPDLTQNSTRLLSSVEMTPPEDDDYPVFPVSENYGAKNPVAQMSTSSSVFMSPQFGEHKIEQKTCLKFIEKNYKNVKKLKKNFLSTSITLYETAAAHPAKDFEKLGKVFEGFFVMSNLP